MKRKDFDKQCRMCPANFGAQIIEIPDFENPENDIFKVACVLREDERKCGIDPY